MSIELYTAATPNGRKVSIALEELGVPYQVRALDLNTDSHTSPEFHALNPNGKIPAIRDGEIVVWESGAILLYLADRYDPDQRLLSKADAGARFAAIQHAFFQASALGPSLGQLFSARRNKRRPDVVEMFAVEVDRQLAVLGRILDGGQPFISGAFSLTDIMIYPWLWYLLDQQYKPLMQLGKMVSWLERVGQRTAMQRGMAVPAPPVSSRREER